MEKKCFVALLMVVVMMCACWTGAVAEDERDYQYALLDDGTVEITGYNGKAEKLLNYLSTNTFSSAGSEHSDKSEGSAVRIRQRPQIKSNTSLRVRLFLF